MSDCEENINQLLEIQRTPRKSARKSVRPEKDYAKVITKMSLRSANKECAVGNETPARWTPAKVGRTSEKRKSRKSRFTVNRKLKMPENEYEVLKEDDQAQQLENFQIQKAEIEVEKQEKNYQQRKTSVKENNEVFVGHQNISASLLDSQKRQLIDDSKRTSVKESNVLIENKEEVSMNQQNVSVGMPDCERNQLVDDLKKSSVEEVSLDQQNVSNSTPNLKKNESLDDLKKASIEKVNVTIENIEQAPVDEQNVSVGMPDSERNQLVDDLKKSSVEEVSLDQQNVSNSTPDFKKNESFDNLKKAAADEINVTIENTKQVPVDDMSDSEENQLVDDSNAILIFDDSIDQNEENVEKTLNRTFDKIDDINSSVKLLPAEESAKFSLSDSVIIIDTPQKAKVSVTKTNFEIPIPKIIVTDEQNLEILKTPKLSSINKQKTKGYRFGTPYKPNIDFSFNKISNTPDSKKLSNTLVTKVLTSRQKTETNKMKNVTKRRKRSHSLDEKSSLKATAIEATLKSDGTLSKSNIKRTKLPLFSAIHSKQFDKMENIVDHVKRKAERAKFLCSSTTKIPIVSEKEVVASTQLKPMEQIELKENKPKAAKRINLSQSKSKVETLTMESNNEELPTKIRRLAPINLPSGILKLKESPKKLKNVKPKTTPIPVIKPTFNLSTALPKPTTFSALDSAQPTKNSNKSTTIAEKAAKTQQHIERFKGGRNERQQERNKKTKTIIQGVRSNRRFDLQMQHRLQMEQNEKN